MKRKYVIYEFGVKKEIERIIYAYRWLKSPHHITIINPTSVISGETRLPKLPKTVTKVLNSLIQSLVK